mmetsp:Transcript_43697/g.78626  ORF Transcript_43697/g.78626 Transcript_43697/m.78626 type:complete len:219 (+) Transcript_43697:762-1418(+)
MDWVTDWLPGAAEDSDRRRPLRRRKAGLPVDGAPLGLVGCVGPSVSRSRTSCDRNSRTAGASGGVLTALWELTSLWILSCRDGGTVTSGPRRSGGVRVAGPGRLAALDWLGVPEVFHSIGSRLRSGCRELLSRKLGLGLLVSKRRRLACTVFTLSHRGQWTVRCVTDSATGSDLQMFAFMQTVPKTWEHVGITHMRGVDFKRWHSHNPPSNCMNPHVL